MKNDVSPTKNGPDSPDIANIILKQREDGKRSESPAVSKPVIRRDSCSAEKVPKLKQPLKFVDENHIFCDGISDFLTDNTDFVVIGVFGLQNAGKSTILNCLAKLSPDDEDIFRVQNFEHQMLGMNFGLTLCVNIHVFIMQESIAPMVSTFTSTPGGLFCWTVNLC